MLSHEKLIHFHDGFAGWQILVSQFGVDATNRAAFQSLNEKIARVDAKGFVVPSGDGETQVQVKVGDNSIFVPVKVQGVSHGRAIDFRTEVVPLLSKHGCNAGGCHGKASGQNGFKLSLFGFDSDFDFESITQEAKGRRIFPANAENSLILLKASGQMPHGGGKKLTPESSDYQTMLRWIIAGAPPVAKNIATVQRIRMLPKDGIYVSGQTQQSAVIAEYSDGSFRDVTRQSEFSSNLDVIASVDASGMVKAGSLSGEAAIMARHMGFVAVSNVMVPHGKASLSYDGFQPINKVDELALDKWKKLGLQPSPVCDDGTFIRRLTVDLCGRLPTADESKAFLNDKDPAKRSKLVDKLLDGPDYPAYFAMKWGSILRNSSHAGADRAAYAFHNWIKDMIARNRPYDEFVRGIIAASGEWQDAPAVNWYWQSRDDQVHQVT
ncbi:MAG: DUF1549 domain-containing protein, partial [Planctomycetia bacterium]